MSNYSPGYRLICLKGKQALFLLLPRTSSITPAGKHFSGQVHIGYCLATKSSSLGQIVALAEDGVGWSAALTVWRRGDSDGHADNTQGEEEDLWSCKAIDHPLINQSILWVFLSCSLLPEERRWALAHQPSVLHRAVWLHNLDVCYSQDRGIKLHYTHLRYLLIVAAIVSNKLIIPMNTLHWGYSNRIQSWICMQK